MENKTFYNEILTEHNLHPYHKHKLEDANLVLEGVNPSCGDDIFLELKVEDGVVVDGAFEGDGCAISQASADMRLELVIGRSKEEALWNMHSPPLFLHFFFHCSVSKKGVQDVSLSFYQLFFFCFQ